MRLRLESQQPTIPACEKLTPYAWLSAVGKQLAEQLHMSTTAEIAAIGYIRCTDLLRSTNPRKLTKLRAKTDYLRRFQIESAELGVVT